MPTSGRKLCEGHERRREDRVSSELTFVIQQHFISVINHLNSPHHILLSSSDFSHHDLSLLSSTNIMVTEYWPQFSNESEIARAILRLISVSCVQQIIDVSATGLTMMDGWNKYLQELVESGTVERAVIIRPDGTSQAKTDSWLVDLPEINNIWVGKNSQ